ncbi:Thiamine biosynthesis lipoprotein ApbE precursor [Acholeplasma oculi]|uniref:FAD:protein FMN transferase n=1 Tax=Acholeplasma oculi TaxID=35623 RepID=A0A061AIK4_9MOLU|nr:FAD:protein FMN transferase [Acholeplasma oculi]CDR31461.1 Thiamine biosynthesis lipoprotein ApbE [Acholeplasma oculi]SKC48955.1 thiamine biosynthesis lipoprotein [Acholeplasma oculi]SUT92130.1 Thiamine biosynthesis lipoprotein ApbE precursor [Acholeplasma oculi]
MKRIFLIINFIMVSILLSACQESPLNLTRKTIAISTMNTFIEGYVYVENHKWPEVFEHIKDIYQTYHVLTDNYIPQEDGVKGIYYINQLVDQSQEAKTVEIEYELYELLEQGLYIRELTGGYFDMAQGKLIDVWKNFIDEYDVAEEVSSEAVSLVTNLANETPIIEDALSLSQVDGKYYVTLKYGAKIDLGAIAKGFATQKVANYLNELGYKEFLINGGSSSIVFGEGNRRNEEGVFNFGLKDPLDVVENLDIFGHEAKLYAIYSGINSNVTTSGSYEQFIKHQGTWFHHIISPITKKPENHYLSITVTANDAGLMDGLSTALFSMPIEMIKEVLKDTDIEAIIYTFEGEIIRVNPTERIRIL